MSATENDDKLPELFAFIWKANKTDDEFNPAEFEERIPRLMTWLKSLKDGGHLVACGGGGFENHAGGLTLVRAKDIDEAMKLSARSPMNEIGTTEILFWDVFYGDLSEKKNESKLV
jgi:hypothetical protein